MCYKHCLLILAALGLANTLPGTNSENTTAKYNIASSECPPPFEIVNNGCYYFSDVQLDFDQAVAYCKSLGHGHIYEITLTMLDYGREDDQALLDAVTARHKTFWVGGKTDDGVQYKWINGRNIYIDAPFWDIREPNEVDNKCMVAKINTFSPRKRTYLYDHKCTDSLNFICQRVKCPMDFIKIGNYCYLQSWTIGVPDLSWQNARDYCQSLSVLDGYHADLAVLGMQDQDDYQLMNSLMASHINTHIWIGAYRDTECSYKWIDGGELLYSSMYWYYTEPGCASNEGVSLYHYSSYKRACFIDVPTSNSNPFICQMYKDA